MPIVEIVPHIQYSKWGDEHFIPSLLGQKPNGLPHSELWVGMHAQGEATLADKSLLRSYVASSPLPVLGKNSVEQFGSILPFLLKILAIAKPLSLQVHPSDQQIRNRYIQEASLPVPKRTYSDTRGKEEILFALTPTTAMCGFLPMPKIRHNFECLVPSFCSRLFPFSDATSHYDFFENLHAFSVSEKKKMLAEYRQSLVQIKEEESGPYLSKRSIGLQCLDEFADDMGALAPWFLHVLHLGSGQALYVEPGIMHSYVKGAAVELMSPSDAVIRGGLTDKKIDVEELMKIASWQAWKPHWCAHIQLPEGGYRLQSPSAAFELRVYESGSYYLRGRRSVEMLLCTNGWMELRSKDKELKLRSGKATLVGYETPSYHLQVSGQVCCAAVPLHEGV
jgi:mannose-6-phosphate isomerase